ncbi:uncharacterized protein LOC111035983 isoform X2 [Myzus persicae]|uniref:uncharacterized protein LOC111035983 isoform X2 n=1 Tax=Myzus persicae TaxID=13164 RepID=UPI000B938DAE|nr:uncharacterized protein LOC111035983 isoform X2 [Myzus persicae]
MPYLSAARENGHSDSRLKLFNGLFRWKKSEKEKQKTRQLSKSEVCIATSMSVKTRNSCPASPALSMPRSRDVFQDMEALKISRHDNPYLQKKILTSRESLLDDNIVVSDTDDIDIMAQDLYGDRCKSPQGRTFLHSSCSSGSSSCVVSPRYNHQSRCHRSASESRGKHV